MVDSPHDHDLISYYGNEVAARASRQHDPRRDAARDDFVELLRTEGRTTVLEVGCGAGQDGQAFSAAGLDYLGTDLTAAGVTHCRELGLDAETASVLDLPFDDHRFAGGWTMSTLLHIPDDLVDLALRELTRVLQPGAPLAVGVWGGPVDSERHHDSDADFGPARFFSSRSDATWRARLAAVATVETWRTWPGTGPVDFHYQFALLRTPAA